MINYSPLRYPGGKNKLSKFVSAIIKRLDYQNITYIEPFAGGAGVAIALLQEDTVDTVVINDYDKAVYSFWRAIKEEAENLIDKINTTPVTISEWYKQKEIYKKSKTYSLELAFSFLFLNRTNHSGILEAGPIGGYAQDGKWKLDARYNKEDLISKIDSIAKKKNKIVVYNKDILSLINNYIPVYGDHTFIYFDPPYFCKGQKLYKNFFTPNDHKTIKDLITTKISCPWLITYDDVPDIKKLYSEYQVKKYDLTYSAANKGTASELMIFSDDMLCPSIEQMKEDDISLNLR